MGRFLLMMAAFAALFSLLRIWAVPRRPGSQGVNLIPEPSDQRAMEVPVSTQGQGFIETFPGRVPNLVADLEAMGLYEEAGRLEEIALIVRGWGEGEA